MQGVGNMSWQSTGVRDMWHSSCWEDDDGRDLAQRPGKELAYKRQWRNCNIDAKCGGTDTDVSMVPTKLKQIRLPDSWSINSKKSNPESSMTQLPNRARADKLITLQPPGMCFDPHLIPPVGTSGSTLFLSRMPGQHSQSMLPIPYQSVMPCTMPFPMYQHWGSEPLNKPEDANLSGCYGSNAENAFGRSMPKYGEKRDVRSVVKQQSGVTNKSFKEKCQIDASEIPRTKNHTTGTNAASQAMKPEKMGTLFIAANISELQAWKKVQGDPRIIYEVVGALDSQVTLSQNGICKSFLLKDGKGSRINCSFYETDRKLDLMCRGRLYRCVGIYKETGGFFLSVSIRPVDKTDVRLHRKLTAIGNCALKKRRR